MYTISLADAIKEVLVGELGEYNFKLEDFYKNLNSENDHREYVINVNNFELFVYFNDRVKQLFGDIEYSSEIMKVINSYDYWSIRRLMQAFGTDIVCNIRKFYWCNVAYKKAIESGSKNIFIPDLRQDHEYNFFKDKNSYFINVINNNIEKTDTHITENSLGNIDYFYVIDNTNKNNELNIQCEKIYSLLEE